mmetsp:Transcript_53211/g.168958  ORF Transcript_53211/g.168958 Transcript_53211/m.168958 type:complete len:161 (+) Transcript_53211:469-951(+)
MGGSGGKGRREQLCRSPAACAADATAVLVDRCFPIVMRGVLMMGLLPQFGKIVLTTSAGIMDHEEARRKKIGGKVRSPPTHWQCYSPLARICSLLGQEQSTVCAVLLRRGGGKSGTRSFAACALFLGVSAGCDVPFVYVGARLLLLSMGLLLNGGLCKNR